MNHMLREAGYGEKIETYPHKNKKRPTDWADA